jgi:hypothetical protein
MQRLRGAIFLSVFALTGCVVAPPAQRVHVQPAPVTVAPPPPRYETIPAPPSRVHVWRAGHWHWNGNGYYWVPSHYALRPYAAAIWVPDRWVASGGGWVFVAGQWR